MAQGKSEIDFGKSMDDNLNVNINHRLLFHHHVRRSRNMSKNDNSVSNSNGSKYRENDGISQAFIVTRLELAESSLPYEVNDDPNSKVGEGSDRKASPRVSTTAQPQRSARAYTIQRA